jgi:Domain of unknown function (DUF4439)
MMGAVSALQECVAAEHAAVYGYGVVGGVLAAAAPGSAAEAYAVSSYDEHRTRRDALAGLVASLHAVPVAADPAYRLPFPVTDAASSRRLARLIEHRTCAVYGLAVATTTRSTRRMAARAMVDCAQREVDWGAEPAAFPGLPELS